MKLPFAKYYELNKTTIISAKRHIVFAILIFILGIVLGYTFFKGSKVLEASYINEVKKIYSNNYMMMVSNIFIHNIIICYLSLRLGVFFGVIPIVFLLATGIMGGWIFTVIPVVYYFKVIIYLLPHGIFELPAMFIASGVGIWRTKLLFVPNYEKATKENVREIHYLFLFSKLVIVYHL